MPIVKSKEVATFRERLFCTKLKCDAEMSVLREAYMTNPIIYAYQCSECGAREESKILYPNIVHKEV